MLLTTDQTLRQAAALHQAGQLKEAEQLYRKILQHYPEHPMANHNLGVLNIQAQHPDAALPYFVAALNADPAQGQFWLSYIDALIQAGQTDEARKILELAQQQGLHGPEVDTLAANLQTKSGMPDSQPLPRPGKQPTAHEINSLSTLFNQGKLDKAIRIAQQMSARYPQHEFAWKVLGAALMREGKPAGALPAMQQTAMLAPHDANAHYNLGVSLQKLGRLHEAADSYRRTLQIKPDYAQAHSNLGTILNSMGQSMEAEASFRSALQANPDFAEAHNNLATNLQERGQLEEAVACVRQALRLKPEYAEAYGNLGVILQKMGRRDEALASFRQQLALSPDNATAQYQISILTGNNAERAPADYIETLFDNYANKFDTHLQQVLLYDVPAKVAQLVEHHLGGTSRLAILDLGCGTGLVGAALARHATQLVGVDLSANMLARAQARNIYQRLEHQDLQSMLEGEQTASYDLTIAADVFVYLGKLDIIISEIARTLRPGGLFAFSVETSQPEAGAPDSADSATGFRLNPTGRYSHATAYLEQLAAANNFSSREMLATCIRTENGQPVNGYVVLWQKPA